MEKQKLVYYRTASNFLLEFIPYKVLKKNRVFLGKLLRKIEKRKSRYDKQIKITLEFEEPSERLAIIIMEKELTPEEIAKIIDPDNTFLDECEEVVTERFRKDSQS